MKKEADFMCTFLLRDKLMLQHNYEAQKYTVHTVHNKQSEIDYYSCTNNNTINLPVQQGGLQHIPGPSVAVVGGGGVG